MYEVPEEPEDSPPLPAGGQTETGGLSLAQPSIPPAAEVCVTLSGRFGYFAFLTPQSAVVNALCEIGPAVFERANLRHPHSSSLLGYTVYATRDLARSRLAIIVWPAGLSGDNQAFEASPAHAGWGPNVGQEMLMAEIVAATCQRPSHLLGDII
ncbi:hypothetical protein RF11_08489 [Thelohanellus kitauei]|uniref:Uncharacterized protein n=1 Tax=Thelohanellus kitauei TaxID=669202 RepID=A0A0C2N395_THEKT|nr:hypothetical protein RF11_08489 [Thelohanellus kitauei]